MRLDTFAPLQTWIHSVSADESFPVNESPHGWDHQGSEDGQDWDRSFDDSLDATVVVWDDEPETPDHEYARRSSEDDKTKPKKQPRYNVILWDDNEHTYGYVIRMVTQLFGYSKFRAAALAFTVDSAGKAICLTTTLEHAELKRDQIHSFGRDDDVDACAGSMSATIEPVDE